MSVEALVIDRQAFKPSGDRTYPGIERNLSDLRSRAVTQVTTLFMAVHHQGIDTWVNHTGKLLGMDFTAPDLLRDVQEARKGIGKELEERVKQYVSQEVERVFPSPLKGQPARGVSVAALEEELVQAIGNQASAAERIAQADAYLKETSNFQSLIPQSIAELATLTEELRQKWARGKPESAYSYTLEKYEQLKAEISARAEAARTTIATWERDELIISARHWHLESRGYRDAYEIELALESARSAQKSGSWEEVREKVARAYERIRWAERRLFEGKIEEVMEELTPRLGEAFTDGLRSIDADRYGYLIANYADRRGWGRKESGLSVWLSNLRDEEAIRDEFEGKYLPPGYVVGHPQAQTLEGLPEHLRVALYRFDSGHVLVWLPVEVDGVVIAAGCSLETEYREDESNRTRMPDTGAWIADETEVMTQLRAALEKTVDPADPEYYQELEAMVAEFIEKAQAAVVPSAQEVKEAFLKYHPLQKDYYQKIRLQLADLRKQRAQAEQKLKQLRSQIRGMSGWKARQKTDPVEGEISELESQIRSLEDALAGSGGVAAVESSAGETFELGNANVGPVNKPTERVAATADQLQALVNAGGQRVVLVGEGAPTKPAAKEKTPRDRIALWTTLIKQDTAALIRQLELLVKTKDDPAQATLIRAILVYRGVKVVEKAKISDDQIGDAEKALRKVMSQARDRGAYDTVKQLEEAQRNIARVKAVRQLLSQAVKLESVTSLLGEDREGIQKFQTHLLARLEGVEELPAIEGLTKVVEELLSQMTSGS